MDRLAQFESPIESWFWLTWRFLQQINPEARCLEIVPQMPITLFGRSYRFDFVVLPFTRDKEHARRILDERRVVVVELDGHEFHERTCVQVASRNQRDIDVQQTGFVVAHISGSELYRGAIVCAERVLALAQAHRLPMYATASLLPFKGLEPAHRTQR
jgi:hypothetical protein